ncbi:MAG: O-antigen ligase family protein [Candidatus Peribacteraceae bacterium]
MRSLVRGGILSWLFLLGMMGSAAAFLPLSALEFTLPKLPFIGIAAVAGLLLSVEEGAERVQSLLFRSGAGRLLLAFFLVSFLSPLWSVAPLQSLAGDPPRFEGAVSYVLLLALAVTGATLGRSGEGRGLLIRALAWSAVPVVLYGILQAAHLDPLGAAWQGEAFLGRVFSTLGHPNFLGQFLLLTLPFVSLRMTGGERAVNLRWTAVFLLGVVVLAATGSRAALLGLGVAAALAAAMTATWSKRGASILALGVLLAAAVGGTAVVRRLEVPTQTGGLGARGVIWQTAVRMAVARPLGYGLETVGSVSPQYLPASIYRYESLTVQIDRAHSKPLDLLLTLGLPGLIAYYGFLALLLFPLWRKRKEPLALVIFLSLAGGSAALLFGFDVLPTHAFFWLIVGMGVGCAVPAAGGGKQRRPFFLPALTVFAVAVTAVFCVWVSARVLLQAGEDAAARGDRMAAVQATVRASRMFPLDRAILVRAAEAILSALPAVRDPADSVILNRAFDWEMARLRRLLPPQDATVHLLAARHAALRGDASAVAAATEEALRLWPHSVRAHESAFRAERAVGDEERALTIARRLISLLPEGWRNREDARMRILWKENPWLKEVDSFVSTPSP